MGIWCPALGNCHVRYVTVSRHRSDWCFSQIRIGLSYGTTTRLSARGVWTDATMLAMERRRPTIIQKYSPCTGAYVSSKWLWIFYLSSGTKQPTELIYQKIVVAILGIIDNGGGRKATTRCHTTVTTPHKYANNDEKAPNGYPTKSIEWIPWTGWHTNVR